ncbi:hypothetical protein H1P_1420010 [Hyella patelloides LEGE 07179]|uniref:Uncharacterized protein n=1 Tax=Hyella patelloides LEGE 07179 TaxID=945734 RepID=A0A563VLJ3_9CYAN|nr:hypothetical protein H1P_1420010 [Hyella patelloides LEGE 07179]
MIIKLPTVSLSIFGISHDLSLVRDRKFYLYKISFNSKTISVLVETSNLVNIFFKFFYCIFTNP